MNKLNIRKTEKILYGILISIAIILGFVGSNYAIDNAGTTQTSNPISVTYNTHIQNKGWENDFSKKDGQSSGTSGQSLRLEGIKIKLENADGINIKYQTHIQNVGWQSWKTNGQMSGTSGQSLRLEGIKIELEGTDEYSVQYRVHVQNIGWQSWRTDGEMAGTSGQSLRLEGIEIKIVPKVIKGRINIDATIPDISYGNDTIKVAGWKMANVSNTIFKVSFDNNEVNNIQKYSRIDVIQNTTGIGTAEQNPEPGFHFFIDTTTLQEGEHTLSIQLLTQNGETVSTYTKKMKIDRSMHVQYSTHIENVGWQAYRNEGELSGTNTSNKIEAIKIRQVNFPQGVTLKYKGFVQNIGWQDWKTDDSIAGTEGKNLRLEAIRMKLEGTDQYSVMYRTKVENAGWQDWCYDDETAGTQDASCKILAIEIKIVPKVNRTRVAIFIDNPTNEIRNKAQNISGWIMTSVPSTGVRIFIDNNEINTSNLIRTRRQDVLNTQKGYGNESTNNPNPGFAVNVDFSKYSLGAHTIRVEVTKDGTTIGQTSKTFVVKRQITTETGIYGYSGLKVAGDSRGSDLPYYRWGDGPNVLFATFAIHGYEDLWAKDGNELVEIANNFYNTLIYNNEYSLADKWTIYIFPGVNQDGLKYGYTNNGPGRTTLFSAAPGHKGIDLNRCWGPFTKMTSNRNYNGTAECQAYEAQYLRSFLLNHKSQNGQTLLVDLHGWMTQVIGDPIISSYYCTQFPESDRSSINRYGTGFLINWARNNLGSTTRACRSALIELPSAGVNGHQSVINKNFSGRYIEATLSMLRNMSV